MSKPGIEIIYEDTALLIVSKPPELLTVRDRHEPEKPNLQDLLNRDFGRVWTVHRLDRETSGILVFARNAEAHRNLSQQFEARTVSKIYHALVDGTLLEKEGQIDKPIGPHPSQPGLMAITRTGKPALTLYHVVETFRRFSLLEADIRTGRTHQIRVHLASIGHPLAVDPLYGKRDSFYLSEVKGQNYRIGRYQEEHPLMSRASLHAWRLEIDHPETGARIHFEAAPPKDFSALLKQLRKWDKS